MTKITYFVKEFSSYLNEFVFKTNHCAKISHTASSSFFRSLSKLDTSDKLTKLDVSEGSYDSDLAYVLDFSLRVKFNSNLVSNFILIPLHANKQNTHI